jgi:curli production assembly/transport component CsgG
MTSPPANGFNHDEIEKLLGGYATGTLTPPERDALFQAALSNQALFDALAGEEALRELLHDPESRRRLLASICPPAPARFSWLPQWVANPRALTLAGTLATALLVVVGVRYQSSRSQTAPAFQQAAAPTTAAQSSESADAPASKPRAESVARMPAPPPLAEKRERFSAATPAKKETAKDELASNALRDIGSRQNAPQAAPVAGLPAPSTPAAQPAVAGAVSASEPSPAKQAASAGAETAQFRRAAEPQKLKVAVIGLQAANERDRQVQDLLAKKLDSSGNYAVVDQKEVDRVREARKLQNKPIDAATAASIGRSVGADTVIVADTEALGEPSSVRAKTAAAQGSLGGAGGGAAGPAGYRLGAAAPRKEMEAKAKPSEEKARADKDARQDQGRIVAQAIDSRTAANVGVARTQTGSQAALGDSVDQVASQLNAQLSRQQSQAQNNAPPFEGLVTDVNATVLTIDLGTRAGVKAGDRLDIRRDNKSIGTLTVTRAEPTFSVGVFQGAPPARAGDKVLKPR